MTHDSTCLATLQRDPQKAVPWLLMASWLYYHRGVSILSDSMFDWVCKTAGMNWDAVSGHRHARLITPIDLFSGSLYRLRPEDYPEMTRDTAEMLAREIGVL